MSQREKDLSSQSIIHMEGNKTSISNLKLPKGIAGYSARKRTRTFSYDFSYDSTDCESANFVSQEKIFKDLGSDVLLAAFQGYNACIFAYGQTGSGKSFTMMGSSEDRGLIPRICEGLFGRIAGMTLWDKASFCTKVSYLEIYNERIRDLLRKKSSLNYNLRVREHPKAGPYVEDLSKHLVQNYCDVEELMEMGNAKRTTASTVMNNISSRSHAIFTINFTQAKFGGEMPCETVSKIHLVDLAGSERAHNSGSSGVRLKEGGNINKSLVTLGNVISALADWSDDGVSPNMKKRHVFVPYRDSVLTWLLKDSLGGNSKTIMIATISPADLNYSETLSTLRYANRAKNIMNKPTINEDSNVKLIRELRAEIARLKVLLGQGSQIALLDSPTALSMEEKLHENEARVLELTKEWTNKWNETQNILKEETLALRKEGIGVVLDSELPHLIGIDEDLLSTGIILYHLKEGRTSVGRDDAEVQQDIVLHGPSLEREHCVFENLNDLVTLVPLGSSQCFVNGIPVMEPYQLSQGAVILLGRMNMFRFNHPKEAAKMREKRKSTLLSSPNSSMTDVSESSENLSSPAPQPGCVLLFESIIYAIFHDRDLQGDEKGLAVFHQLQLQRIREVHVGFAGQHVRVLGTTEHTIFTMYTYSKQLTQGLCQALLRGLSPEAEELSRRHPLLQGDLMELSLNWKAYIPDLCLNSRLRLSSQFKRALADLVYFLHGNMKEKPSLADVHLLLYTSVRVKVSPHPRPHAISWLLLTDTHVGLVQEDGVFHPTPRSITLMPKQAHFEQVALRELLDVRCVLVADRDSFITVDVVFKATRVRYQEFRQLGKNNMRAIPSLSEYYLFPFSEVWELTFGCRKEAAFVINHLSMV
uniref:Kinesin-like protein n=1 Tax=Scleropages formosus TaxID=113540 RepID=A0A8C9VP02_SCLFO